MSLFKQALPSLRLMRGLGSCRPLVVRTCRPVSSDALSKEELQVAESVLARLSSEAKEDEPAASIGVDHLPLKPGEWSRSSRRCGAIAIKLGMSQVWTNDGTSVAVTLLQVVDNEVVMVRTREGEGYNGLQVGAVNHPKIKNISKPVLGQFARAHVTPKRVLQEFRVSEDALLPVGTSITASHFTPGQYVDVCANTIGKGFAGVMKRHGMSGMPASHGVTKAHRKMGATGGGQDPGRIWPGKKMPGRMGGKRATQQCLKVYRVNHKYNVLYVRGPVPGHTNTYVRVTDARRKPRPHHAPFPTGGGSETEETYCSDIHFPHQPTLDFPDKRKK